MNFQIRLRESDTQRVQDFLNDYIYDSEKVLIFKHSPPKIENGITVYVNEHHHIYLFLLERKADSIRKYIGRYYDKTRFSVKTTSGGTKNLPITLEGAYQYGTSEHLLAPVFSKGVEESHLDVLRMSAEVYYKPQGVKLNTGDVIIVTKEIHHEKQDRVWLRLLDQRDIYIGKTVPQIKSMIAAEWLNSGKALPRPCDLHRYSLSLFYKNKYTDEIPADALEDIYRIN